MRRGLAHDPLENPVKVGEVIKASLITNILYTPVFIHQQLASVAHTQFVQK